MPPPSSAKRLAAHWVADAVAADEAIDFSVIEALVGDSPESLTGAPDLARERVALRCLEELSTIAGADEGRAASAPEPSKILRVDAIRSCEDLLVELIGKVGSSRNPDKDIIPPFRQDIQNFICIKKLKLPESSLELLREVDPEIPSMVAPSSVKQNGTKKHDSHQSLCNAYHLNSNIETHGPPIVNTELQPDNLTNLVNKTDVGNFKQCPIKPTVDLDQAVETDRIFYSRPGEDVISAACVGARPTEKDPCNMDSNTSGASTSCNATLQASTEEIPQCNQNQEASGSLGMLSPSSSAKRLAAHWVVDALAADEAIDFSVIEVVVDNLPEHLIGAPDAVWERVALRCLEKFSTIGGADEGRAAAVPQPSKILRVEAARSCQDLLVELIGKVGSSRNLDKDIILPFRQDIQNFICIKKLELPKSSMELLREVDPEIPSMVAPSSVKQNDTKKHDNHQSLCNAYHLNSNIETHGPPIVNTELQPDNLTNLVNKTDVGNFKQCPIKPTVDLDQAVETDRIFCSQAQEDGISAAGVGARRTEKDLCNMDSNMSGASTSCNVTLEASIEEIPQCNQNQEANDSLGVSPEQDLCIKCGKDGQLLKCSSCLLSAHNSCFGSLVTFEDSGQFYCPVCICTKATKAYKKAKKAYIEARKNLAAFLGAEQLLKQRDEQQTRVLPRAVNSEGQLNGHNSSNRQNSSSQTTVDDLAHQGEESCRQRKKQKTNVTSDACNEVVIKKASSVGNSDVAPINKHSELQNNSNQLQFAEDHVGTEAHAGNGYLSHERSLSQNRCSPAANPEVEADKDNGPTNFHHQSEDTDEIESTTSSDSGT